MSIRSSIFTNNSNSTTTKASDAELLFLSKGLLPPLISPTLPPIYKTETIPPLQQLPPSKVVVTNGHNSYTVQSLHNGNVSHVVVKLKVGSLNRSMETSKKVVTAALDDEKEEDEPLGRKRSPTKKVVELRQPHQQRTDNVEPKLDQSILDKRKEKSELFIGKSRHFRNLAAGKKRESDELRHNQQLIKSIVLSLESVITFVVAFDYEDKSRLVEKKLATDKSWITLEPYLNSIIKIIKENMSSNKKLRHLLAIASLLKGLCCQHLINITLSLIHNSKLKINKELKDDKILLLKDLVYSKSVLLVEYQQELTACFKLFEEHLNHLEIKLNFPQTFKKRSLVVEPVQKQESLKPESDQFYIPLSSISPLQQVVLFSNKVITEFSSADDER